MARSANDGLGRMGGRDKGTPNKKSELVEALIDREGINLPLEILKCCEHLKPLDKANVMLKLMEFIYPKRKAASFDINEDPDDRNVTIIFQEVGHDLIQEKERVVTT